MSSPLHIVEKALTIDQQVGCADAETAKSKKIWIDFDNSPHIPFFLPVIGELKSRGYDVLLTARNAYQVCELVEFFHLQSEVLGGHWGKNRFLKVLATGMRTAQLWAWIMKNKPDLAVSHGS